MKYHIALACSILLGSLSLGSIASAANVYDYVQTFDGSGSFDGKDFTNKLITFESSTTSAPFLSSAAQLVYNDDFNSVEISGTLDNGALFSTMLEAPSVIYSFSIDDEVGVGIYGFTYVGITTKDLYLFDLSYAFGPIVGAANVQGGLVPTTGGGFDLASVKGNGTFEETITPLSAAPEPSIWMLMFAGVAMIGGALRLGRKRGAGSLSVA